MNLESGTDRTTKLALPELETMAIVLEARHGTYATHVADFFATAHDQEGDPTRGCAWSKVATLLRRRELARMRQV